MLVEPLRIVPSFLVHFYGLNALDDGRNPVQDNQFYFTVVFFFSYPPRQTVSQEFLSRTVSISKAELEIIPMSLLAVALCFPRL